MDSIKYAVLIVLQISTLWQIYKALIVHNKTFFWWMFWSGVFYINIILCLAQDKLGDALVLSAFLSAIWICLNEGIESCSKQSDIGV